MGNKKTKLGQSILEYSIVIGVVVTALLAMQVYMKRGIQAATKIAADQLSDQTMPEIKNLEKGGFLESANAQSHTEKGRRIEMGKKYSTATDRKTTLEEFSSTNAKVVYNLGEYRGEE